MGQIALFPGKFQCLIDGLLLKSTRVLSVCDRPMNGSLGSREVQWSPRLTRRSQGLIYLMKNRLHHSRLGERVLQCQSVAAQARDDDKAIDLPVVEGFEKSVVVFDRDAAV